MPTFGKNKECPFNKECSNIACIHRTEHNANVSCVLSCCNPKICPFKSVKIITRKVIKKCD
jgi:hypothetical protein